MQPARSPSTSATRKPLRVGRPEDVGFVQPGVPTLVRSQVDGQVELLAAHGADRDVHPGILRQV